MYEREIFGSIVLLICGGSLFRYIKYWFWPSFPSSTNKYQKAMQQLCYIINTDSFMLFPIINFLVEEEKKCGSREKCPYWNMLADLTKNKYVFKDYAEVLYCIQQKIIIEKQDALINKREFAMDKYKKVAAKISKMPNNLIILLALAQDEKFQGSREKSAHWNMLADLIDESNTFSEYARTFGECFMRNQVSKQSDDKSDNECE